MVGCANSSLTQLTPGLQGELPLEVIKLRVKLGYEEDEDGDIDWKVKLSGNKPGFTLPSNIGELGDDITSLDLSECSLHGAWVDVPTHQAMCKT